MSDPRLYILMRNDLASMNPGKAIAQGSHATSFFQWTAEQNRYNSGTKFTSEAYDQWLNGTYQRCGTVITLAVNELQLRTAVAIMLKMEYIAGVFRDDTYPLKDGDITHLIPLDTCGFIFVPDAKDSVARAVLKNFPLHP